MLFQIAILVCSKVALQICKLATNLTQQESKLETSYRKRVSHHASNSLQTIAKTEYEDNLGFEPATPHILKLSSLLLQPATQRGENRLR
ncbi:hypothetical protein AVEN_180093-1 [Araneus ventricosus]|uniref:Uncharacterized protein n=1 Tax=Araneus ventricosus TaxID=182803 RepID=A0A4Y2Q7M5_ARAVE|nr:hypothetical protein AVEN_180093-1 [Araneus ventricosus]